ncbi:MAG: endonuclease III domain-containing protein [Chloroflexi bacterium]|nr:endonuclease III domain-containing protein [Chloroflexota bacterium]
MTSLRGRLLDVYDRMLRSYGPQQWWPGDTPFEVMVGAILTQAASWSNVRKAISNLKDAGALSPEAIRRMSTDELARLVYPSGYYNSKARKLKALVEYLGLRFDDDIDSMSCEDAEELRDELLSVYGIGEETADDILLYAVGKPAFVIDAYTRRVFSRLGLAPERDSYARYRSLFTEALPSDRELFAEYHALIVRHGKELCRKRPLCAGCCLLSLCPTGQALEAQGDPSVDDEVMRANPPLRPGRPAP